jgi:hypothetical protein
MKKVHSGTIQESCKLAISWSTSYMLHYVMWKKQDPTSQQRASDWERNGAALLAKLYCPGKCKTSGIPTKYHRLKSLKWEHPHPC